MGEMRLPLARVTMLAVVIGLTLPQTDQPVVVRFETTLGDIMIGVDVDHAPITSANFLKYVDGGFYTHGRFHRATRADNYTVNLPNRPLLECIQAGINPDRKPQGFPPIALERTSVTGGGPAAFALPRFGEPRRSSPASTASVGGKAWLRRALCPL